MTGPPGQKGEVGELNIVRVKGEQGESVRVYLSLRKDKGKIDSIICNYNRCVND